MEDGKTAQAPRYRVVPRPVALRDLILLFVMGGAWGLQFAMLKLAAEAGRSEISVLFVALVPISLLFCALLALRRAFFRLTGEIAAFLVITGLLGYVIPLIAVLYVAPQVSAGVLTLVASFTPVVTVAIALLLRSEPVSRRRILAVGLGAVAAVLLLLPQIELPSFGALEWLLIAFLVPLAYGYESIYVATHWPKNLDSLQVVTGEAVTAALVLLPFHVTLGDSLAFDPSWPMDQIAIGVFVAAGVLEVMLYFYLIRQTGGVLVSFGTFISLFAGIAWGMILFSERHDAPVWGAVLVLVAALWLVAFDKSGSGGRS